MLVSVAATAAASMPGAATGASVRSSPAAIREAITSSRAITDASAWTGSIAPATPISGITSGSARTRAATASTSRGSHP